ncbi:helix-turn-helix domain-containing protein [Chryseolinea sp. T2]|uniref:helix-turn-helix domain-containing protein n=1 Tax=Chryseolinea sp. T2 TaxID=3129255 RepID=UPI00307895C7
MNGWQILLALVCGIALIQSFFLAALMFVRDGLRKGIQFYLGIMLVGLALRLAKSYFVFIPQSYPMPGIVAGGAGLWLIGPAFYCYARRCLSKEITYRSLIHYLPALVIVITGLIDYVYYVGLLQFAVYWGISIYMLRGQSITPVPKHFRILALFVGLILLCFVVQASQGGIHLYTIGVALAIPLLYVINFFIASDGDFFNVIIRKSRLLDKKLVARITGDLNQLLNEQKIYRNKGLKLSELAKQSSYPAYLISQSINQEYNMRFNEFLNRFRVREAMERLENIRDNDKIETIAKEVGFSSVTSLYDAFRRETQVTPQVYRNRFLQR